MSEVAAMFSKLCGVTAAVCLLAVTAAPAATIGPDCRVLWDYDPAELARVDEFVLYLDGAEALALPASRQSATCSEIGVPPGEHSLAVTARNAVGESAPSNTLTFSFVSDAPAAPGSLRIEVHVSVQVE
jgi:hypothetical protein